MSGLAIGLLWRRAFCLPHPAVFSFCINKYSVVNREDSVALQQQWRTDAQLSTSEYKYAHKTKQLQNQEALRGPSAMEKVADLVSGFPCPRCSCKVSYAAVGLDLLLRLWLGSSARATARACFSTWMAQSLFDSAMLRSLRSPSRLMWPRSGAMEGSFFRRDWEWSRLCHCCTETCLPSSWSVHILALDFMQEKISSFQSC